MKITTQGNIASGQWADAPKGLSDCATRQAHIPAALQRLNGAAEEFVKGLNSLGLKLQPVLRQEPPSNTPGIPSPNYAPTETPLAEEINGMASRIEGWTGTLRSLLERVEL